jgi:hypothetical protein
MTDRLEAIKLRSEYAPAGEPGAGQEDLYWLISEVERMREQVVSMTLHLKRITGVYEQQVNSCSTGECGG